MVADEKFEVLIEDDCEALNAHEAAIFLEFGCTVGDPSFDGRPTLVYTTQPYLDDDDGGAYYVDVRGLLVESQSRALKTLHTSRNLANGGTLGIDGRLYFCFQGAKLGTKEAHPAGVSSVDPHNWDDWRVEVETWQQRPFNSPNDIVQSQTTGSFFFTDPCYAAAQGFAPPALLGDWVWRLDPDGCASVVADNFSRPNGIAFSPDETQLYVTDTGFVVGDGTSDRSKPRSVYAFDVVHETTTKPNVGTKQLLANRRLLYVADQGVPDGIKVDVRGFIYTGCADGVHVVDPKTGCLQGKILIKGNDGGAANLCFGRGPKFERTLFILAEAAIVAVHFQDPDSRGAVFGAERAERGKG